jgi:hypothetical protein
VTSIAVLTSLEVLQQAQILLPAIENCVPLEKMMKIASFEVEPIGISSATNSYMNAYKMMTQP